jgi:hypothetical protein
LLSHNAGRMTENWSQPLLHHASSWCSYNSGSRRIQRHSKKGSRGIVAGSDYKPKVAGSIPDEIIGSAYNRNEYQESSWG